MGSVTMKKVLATILALVMVLSVTTISWADGVVEVGTAEQLKAAVANGGEIKLTADVTVDAYVTINKATPLDLGGKTLTSDASGFDVYKDFTLKNGTVNTATWGVWVQSGAKFTLEADAAVNADQNTTLTNAPALIVVQEGTTLDIYGKATAKGENFAVSGNGSNGQGGVVLNVYEGAEITSPEGIALYFPNTATLNISGGTVKGTSGAYIKSGSATISGGSIIANGAQANYEYYGNGANSTGDALIIDKCNYPGGDPTVSITGGTFTSTNAKAVGSYVGNGAAEPVTAFVSGGTFSTDVKEYLAEGKILQKNGDTYTAVTNSGITSGTYTAKPTVPDGYKVVENTDGTFTVEKVGGYYYYHPTTDTKADGTKGSPKTFDAGVGIYAVTAVLSVTGMAWAAKKRGN